MSGDILYESRTYGEIEQFAKHLPSAMLLEKSILENNPNLGEVTVAGIYSTTPQPTEPRVTRFTWISLDEYIFDNRLGEIEMAIRNENGWEAKDERNYKFNTYEYEGKEVVYFSFYQACYGEATVYAVPVELAYTYKLGDFDGREMSRWDGLWGLLEPYETNIEIEYDDDMGLEDFPYALIETFNYD